MSTAILHKELVKTLVPQLRFREFEEEWKYEPIGKYIDLISGIAFKGEEISEDSIGVPILRGINITEGYIRHNKNIDRYFLGNTDKLDKIRLKEGDLVLAMDGSKVGKNSALITKRDADSLLIQRVARIRAKKNASLQFIYLHINSILFHRYVDTVNTSSGIPHISSKQINDFRIHFPNFNEQQKIASFLITVDEKIQQLSRKKELLEQYKKGVMQQLFSGKLRFKDENGQDYPDWEEKTFGDIYSFYSTNSLSREKLNYERGTVRNIHYGDIHTKFKTLFNIDKELVPFINSDFDISKIKSECYCQEGDLVIADASEDYADIGKSIEIINLQNEKVVAGLHTFLARPNKIKMYIGFSGHIVRSENFRKQIMTIAQGSKVLSISTGRIAMLKMKIPKIEEQQKIANFLSSIDVKIENTNQQITKAKNFKKGLLQQMFP